MRNDQRRAPADWPGATESGIEDITFDVQVADGATARELRIQQARVLWEVTQWVAQHRSRRGLDPAA